MKKEEVYGHIDHMLIIVMGIALNNKRISGFFERKARRKELMKRA